MHSLGEDAITGCSSGQLKASVKDYKVLIEPLAPEVSRASATGGASWRQSWAAAHCSEQVSKARLQLRPCLDAKSFGILTL